ncbi:hypothetical protein [Flavivirga jejuensis]|uniref:SpoIIAA-like protein n=1 Tax=Flavivirga jejuensis TaxID=870487 RepID=A0ABT8WJP3_9FLAO|nr:hypothetical protein [Flavivirga jejuensis]MDO5973380.1 hypothetical protein [Flavivirga jejuensis]
MKSFKLSFGTILIIRNDLAEMIANDGVEMDEVMVAELHDFLLSNLDAPILLLINNKHSYSYTFQAQIKITHLKEIKAIAVIIGTRGALMSTETLININGNNNIKMFRVKENALMWLRGLSV